MSVYRANTGNVHRAVGPDFVLNVGDILYFTGMAKDFGKFCAENGLEVVTSESEATLHATAASAHANSQLAQDCEPCEDAKGANAGKAEGKTVTFAASAKEPTRLARGPQSGRMIIDVEHTSKRRLSMLGPETDNLQAINKMTGVFFTINDLFVRFK